MRTRKRIPENDKKAAIRAYELWKEVKAKTGMTQAHLATKMGCTQGALSSWFHGFTPIGTDALLKMSAIFGVSPTEIRPEFEYSVAVDASNASPTKGELLKIIDKMSPEAQRNLLIMARYMISDVEREDTVRFNKSIEQAQKLARRDKVK